MKFSATVTLQYPTVFSAFSVEDYLKGLDWIRDSGLDGAELCISHYKGLDLGIVKKQLEERKLGCSTLSTGQARGDGAGAANRAGNGEIEIGEGEGEDRRGAETARRRTNGPAWVWCST